MTGCGAARTYRTSPASACKRCRPACWIRLWSGCSRKRRARSGTQATTRDNRPRRGKCGSRRLGKRASQRCAAWRGQPDRGPALGHPQCDALEGVQRPGRTVEESNPGHAREGPRLSKQGAVRAGHLVPRWPTRHGSLIATFRSPRSDWEADQLQITGLRSVAASPDPPDASQFGLPNRHGWGCPAKIFHQLR